MKLPWMQIGARPILRDNGENSGGDGGYEAERSPEQDRVAQLEARLGKLSQAVGSFYQESQQRTQQERAAQEQQQTLRAAQSFVTEAAQKLEAAKSKLQNAHDTGDGAAIASATAEMSTAAAEHTAARMHAESIQSQYQAQANQPQQQKPQQQQPKVDDSNLRQWRERNKSWYGIDPDMTRAAMDAAKEVEGEKLLEVGSPQYFQAIDARLRTRYGDRIPQATAAHVQSQRGSMSSGRPQTQQRIPEAIANGYRRMGINVDDPEVAKQMVAAREKAVQKNFLPAEPQYGSVVTR